MCLLFRVHSNPEAMGKIDFAHYKAALPGLKMVDEFEKAVNTRRLIWHINEKCEYPWFDSCPNSLNSSLK